MVKASILLLNVFGFLFFGIVNDAEILIENNTPAILAPGTKKEVTLTINKGQVQGFSKLELSLPYGFTATPGEIKGASFTFSSQKAKFLWMTLPTEESFTVTYYIESAENMEGNFDVTGTFSYVRDNKREDISIPSKTLLVQKPIGPTPEEVAATMPGVKMEAMVADMYCERIVSKISDTQYDITLRVHHNAIGGTFGRILETFPYNCSSEAVDDPNITITQLNNTIKFVWFETPSTDEFECRYSLTCDDAVVAPEITGLFSYTIDGTPYEQPVTGEGMPSSEATVKTNNGNNNTAQNNSTIDTNNNSDNSSNNSNNNTADNTSNNQTTNNNIDNRDTSDSNNNNATAASNTDNEKPVTNVPSPETGITYKVQILAAHRVVNKTFMKKTYNFTQAYNIENIDGWVKYTTGKFVEYKEARNAREELKEKNSKLPGPFVTAYNDGERITVQEALLISSQQWIQ